MVKRELIIDPDVWNERSFYHFGKGPVPLTVPRYIDRINSDDYGLITASMRYADVIGSVAGIIKDPAIRVTAVLICAHDNLLDMPGSIVPSDRSAYLKQFIGAAAKSAWDRDCY